MNSAGTFLTILTKQKRKILKFCRSFHGAQVLEGRENRVGYGFHRNAENALFFTNLPKLKKEKKLKPLKGPVPYGNLVIECKHSKLNHYSGITYGKFDTVPLACQGWRHRNSKGDHFTILPSFLHPAFVTNEDIPETFEEIGINEKLIQQLNKVNITHPTVIQAKACKLLLSGKNIFISGECGSGKTVAYLIALIENVLKWKTKITDTDNSPIGIVVLPTRELAIQVGTLINRLSADLGIRSQTLIGGQIQDLLIHPKLVSVDILICTLKVLLEHIKSNLYSTKNCKHVIIDEADSLIEQSFIGQLKSFLYESKLNFTGFDTTNVTNQSAQICFVSATVPMDMEEILIKLIKASPIETVSTACLHKTVSYAKQVFLRVGKQRRAEELLKVVKNSVKAKMPTMIFSNKLDSAVWVSEFLMENGIECGKITTAIYAEERLMQYRNFEGGEINVISCTDLASRGLSFSTVKHVVNYEFPTFMIDYIHRSGRTGRLGQGENCKVTNFICSAHEMRLLKKIELAARTNSSLKSIYKDRILHFG